MNCVAELTCFIPCTLGAMGLGEGEGWYISDLHGTRIRERGFPKKMRAGPVGESRVNGYWMTPNQQMPITRPA